MGTLHEIRTMQSLLLAVTGMLNVCSFVYLARNFFLISFSYIGKQ